MALTKYKLGSLLELLDERNSDLKYGIDDVKGISIQKVFIETKADMTGVSLKPYILVKPDSFAYVTVTSRNGEKITIAHNDTENTYIVSSSYVVFRVSRPDLLLSDFLFMIFNRPEFDRYSRFNSWGSARETFSWEEMCDIDIDLPSITVQQKYVDIYNSMLANQRCYERGLEDLKLTIDAIIEKFKNGTNRISLGDLVIESDERNTDDMIQSVNGVNKDKRFMPSVANGSDLTKYKLVQHNQFACNLMHVGRDVAVPVALNSKDEPIIVSPAYIVFNTKDDTILPEFLLMWLSRTETDRYAWFMCDTNVRSGMEKKRFFEIEIPVPSVQEQKSLIEMYDALFIRREVCEKLKAQIKDLCPILVKGAVEEGTK
ncbi:MAG: restriction endonuclease subunit S [Ruminococcus flavefaciens]